MHSRTRILGLMVAGALLVGVVGCGRFPVGDRTTETTEEEVPERFVERTEAEEIAAAAGNPKICATLPAVQLSEFTGLDYWDVNPGPVRGSEMLRNRAPLCYYEGDPDVPVLLIVEDPDAEDDADLDEVVARFGEEAELDAEGEPDFNSRAVEVGDGGYLFDSRPADADLPEGVRQVGGAVRVDKRVYVLTTTAELEDDQIINILGWLDFSFGAA